jgi:small subunit ribosomal protein S1
VVAPVEASTEAVTEDAPAPVQPSATEATPPTTAAEARPAEPTQDGEYPAMTMEDILRSEEDLRRDVNRGDIVSGTVVFVGNEGVALDIGAKIEGTIPLSQIAEEPVSLEQAQEMFKPGDKVDATWCGATSRTA